MLKDLNAAAVEKTFTNWVVDVCKSRPDLQGYLDAVAIDGKTMRASLKSGAIISHLLSIVFHELGVTLKQKGVSGRCGAIPQIMAALRNAALAVLRFAGVTNIADEIKVLASNPKLAVNLITDVF